MVWDGAPRALLHTVWMSDEVGVMVGVACLVRCEVGESAGGSLSMHKA